MVGNDDGLIAVLLGSLDDSLHAFVNSPDSLGNGIVDTRMAHHVAVGKVHHDEVVLLGGNGSHQLILHLVGTHFGLQVVGSHLRAGHQDAVLAFEGSLASAIEEEGDVGILLRLGGVQLLLALLREIFAQRVLHILLREEDVHALEVGVVGRHAVILQAGDGCHALLRHVLLGEHNGELLGAVVAEVDEDDHIALLYAAVHRSVVDRLDELVGDTLVIALLHGLHHIGGLLAGAVDNEVVALLHTLPALVAVHGVEAAHDAGNGGIVLGADIRHLLDEALAALWVGVATVHKAVHEGLVLQPIVPAHLDELEQMV